MFSQSKPDAACRLVMHCPQFRLQLSTSSSRLAQRRRLLLTGNLFGFSLVVATRSQHFKEMYGWIASSPPSLRLLFPLCNQLLPSQFLSVLLFQVDHVRPFSRYDFVQTFWSFLHSLGKTPGSMSENPEPTWSCEQKGLCAPATTVSIKQKSGCPLKPTEARLSFMLFRLRCIIVYTIYPCISYLH